MATYNASTGEIDFGMALDVMKRGQRVKRRGWTDAFIRIKDKGFFIHKDGQDVAWVPEWDDLLALDWSEIV